MVSEEFSLAGLGGGGRGEGKAVEDARVGEEERGEGGKG